MIEDDLHDQLTKAYMEYFKVNEKFEQRNSVRTFQATRKCLREIGRLAKLRWREVQTTYASKK